MKPSQFFATLFTQARIINHQTNRSTPISRHPLGHLRLRPENLCQLSVDPSRIRSTFRLLGFEAI